MSFETYISVLNTRISVIPCLFSFLLLFSTSLRGVDYNLNLSLSQGQKQVNKNLAISNEAQQKPIAEQDPTGIYWGLRDTLSGELVLDYTYQKIWSFNDGFAMVMLNGVFGLIDQSGKTIIEPTYDSPLKDFECGYIAFNVGYGPAIVFDSTGLPATPLISGVSGFLPCQERIAFGNYQYGMMNFDKDTILPFTFRSTYFIADKFCVASKPEKPGDNDLFALYDLDGKQVLPHKFERIGSFSNGLAVVQKNGKYGAIDTDGKELFYTDYSRIDPFVGDYAVVYAPDSAGEVKVGIMHQSGREVVSPKYLWLDNVYNFSNGLAAVAQDWKYGFVDTTGKVVIPFKYDRVESFKQGIAKVWIGNRVGYINRKGEDVIPLTFDALDHANLNRFYNKWIIGIKDSVQYVFDYSGREHTTLPYGRILGFNENEKSFHVLMINKWGTLDSNFSIKIPIEYESLQPISPNKIMAIKNSKVGYIDYEGKVILPFVYDWVEPFEDYYMKAYDNGLSLVGLDGKTGLTNVYGKLVVPIEYDEIEGFYHGLSVVKRNGKFGFVDFKGREVIPPIYEHAENYNGYSAEVTLRNEVFQIDREGNRMEEEY